MVRGELNEIVKNKQIVKIFENVPRKIRISTQKS